MNQAKLNPATRTRMGLIARFPVFVTILVLLAALTGCESDDCLNCVELPPPVVPTGVHSISGDNEVIIQWYDISYAPYDGQYNENVTSYAIYYRDFLPGDENNPNREFYFIGEVKWDENFDPTTGLHWFVDDEARNGDEYEYAVAAVNAAGVESALSYELVTDAPLPMSPWGSNGYIPLTMHDSAGTNRALSGFIFSRAAANQGDLNAGRVDPDIYDEDLLFSFSGGIPYVNADPASVLVQDFGVFSDAGGLYFEGVSWAPYDGYSATGRLELVPGHIYVVQLGTGANPHFAKFGVTGRGTETVDIIWAYQTIAGLPELSIPRDDTAENVRPVVLKL
jgi:hypothetical protein